MTDLALLLLVVFLIAAGVVLLLLGICRLHLSVDGKFRQNVLHDARRLDDAAYAAEMPFRVEDRMRGAVLDIRTAFAKLGRLPRRCVTPDMPIADLFRTQCRLLSTGVDQAEIVMHIEDETLFAVPEGLLDGLNPYGGDTVGVYTEKVIQVLDAHRTTLRETDMVNA